MTNLITFVFTFLLSWLLVGAFSRWSEKRSMVDVPNDRSSHDSPTPVGGGIVIVALTTVAVLILEAYTNGAVQLWPYLLGGIAIAIVSWFDDKRPIPAVFRFAVHIGAAALVIWKIGAFERLDIYSGAGISLGIAAIPFTLLWIVWMTNAYNFMDGIDGLAGVQGVFAAAGWAAVSALYGDEAVTFLALNLMAAILGFLIHNWPPAKVFMGDVGSAFLGFTFAVLPILLLSRIADNDALKGYLPVIGVAFVWLFFADTVITFLRRLFAGEKVWSAHRRHLYQELIKSGQSHLRVTVIYGGLIALICVAVVLEIAANRNGIVPALAVLLILCLAVFVEKVRRTASR